ncbi:MAG: phosphate ABC transporter substrate-binding protein PstS [Bacteriovoracaceae bacterium]
MKHLLIWTLSLLATFSIAEAKVKINGAGASFPFPIYSKWFSEYEKVNTEVQFNYQAIGSGGGIRQLIKQTVDFGASDAPMKVKDKKKAAWPVKHVPTVLGAVSVAYNLPSVKKAIKLDGQTLAGIFLTEITKWNDKKIMALNPGITLPNTDILVVRRADGSGTTAIFSDYLSKVSNDWKEKIGTGKTLRWPGTTIGAKGNDGVTGVLKKTKGSIGYVELAYALKNQLPVVSLKNKSGKYVAPSIEGISASAASLKSDIKELAISITDADGDKVYPISAFTYILLPVKSKADAKLMEVKKFLDWALGDGQKYAETLHYAPLPKNLAKRLRSSLTK